MNMQTFTVESLNIYRQDELHKASEAVRAERASVGATRTRRFSTVSGVITAIRSRMAVSQQTATSPASR